MRSVERVSLVQQVVDGIRDLISDADLGPGDRLPTEAQLVETFKVGRSTIREALHVLQALEVIEVQPGRGSFVTQQKPRPNENQWMTDWLAQERVELSDLMEIRTALEPIAARLASERGTEEQRQELQEIHRMLVEATREGDEDKHNRALEVAKLDERFHGQIAKMSHNKVMISIERNISEALLEARVRSFSVPERMKEVERPHGQVLSAIERRDGTGAALAMEMHVRTAFLNEDDGR